MFNTTGAANSASGFQALDNNTTGNNNTASGYQALNRKTTGPWNTASGYQALYNNRTGQQNTASGVYALRSNTSGLYNSASGVDALFSNTTGSSNIAEGYKAGYNLTTGSNNIDIGNQGVAAESATIRIGTTSTHNATYIAGIYNVTSLTSGLAVFVDSTGHLGTASSSERFKTDIESMGSNTTKLQQLRPVTFHYKADSQGTLRYGLIAEEVAKVYPELVVRDSNGRIDGVRYDELAPMLLNEMQKRNAAQDQHIAAQDAKISQLMGQSAEMHAALVKLTRKDELVAQR